MNKNGKIKLEHRITRLEVMVENLSNDFIQFTTNHFTTFSKENKEYHDLMSGSLKDLSEKLHNSLPIWATILITLLTSLAVGLIILALK